MKIMINSMRKKSDEGRAIKGLECLTLKTYSFISKEPTKQKKETNLNEERGNKYMEVQTISEIFYKIIQTKTRVEEDKRQIKAQENRWKHLFDSYEEEVVSIKKDQNVFREIIINALRQKICIR